MKLPNHTVDNGGIGSLPIDPGVELIQTEAASISGKQEIEFFRQAGTQFHLSYNQQNLGWLGKFFGANSSASTNIAGVVIICSFLVIVFFAWENIVLQTKLADLFIGLIASALGFIFGAASKK